MGKGVPAGNQGHPYQEEGPRAPT